MFKLINEEEINNHKKNLNHFGYCILTDYINYDFLKIIKEVLIHKYLQYWSLAGIAEKAAPVGMQNLIKNDLVINNLFYFDRIFFELSTRGQHLDIIGHFLNDPYYGIIPKEDNNFLLAQMNGRNGKSPLPFHNDVRLKTPGEKCWSMQCFLSLDLLDKNNGGLRVRPLSHLNGLMPNSSLDYTDAITLKTNPGDLIIFNSKLDHATESNIEDLPGWTILITYRSWWAKQQFDIFGMIGGKYNDTTPQQDFLIGKYSVPSINPFDSASSRSGY